MNVLIVEDEKSLSDEIALFLKSEGYSQVPTHPKKSQLIFTSSFF
jgi:DNA-binding response OmpR family regulator